MSRRLLSILLAILLAIVTLGTMNVSVWANNDSAGTTTANIKLWTATTVGTTKLAPGEYKVTADASKATFQQGNKVVAEVPCTLKDISGKISVTTFATNHDQITEIQVAGRSKTIEFSSGQ